MTMPSDAAKKASTSLMKCCSPGVSVSQSLWSIERSISSLVQNDATCCLYMRYMSFYLIGNNTNRLVSSFRRNSTSLSLFISASLLANFTLDFLLDIDWSIVFMDS